MLDMLAKRLRVNNLDFTEYRRTLTDKDGEALSKLIQENRPSIKRITLMKTNFSKKTIDSIINALAVNTQLTQFIFDYKNATPSQRAKIKSHLIVNKAQKKIMGTVDKASTFWRVSFMLASIAFTFSTFVKSLSWPIALSASVVYQALYEGARLYYHKWFRNDHQWAKNSNNITTLSEQRAFELGKRCANEWLVWAHPKSWTPLAYLGYTIEKHKLNEVYGLNQPSRPSKTRRANKA